MNIIQAKREELGLSIKKLSAILGCSPSALSRVEKGDWKVFSKLEELEDWYGGPITLPLKQYEVRSIHTISRGIITHISDEGAVNILTAMMNQAIFDCVEFNKRIRNLKKKQASGKDPDPHKTKNDIRHFEAQKQLIKVFFTQSDLILPEFDGKEIWACIEHRTELPNKCGARKDWEMERTRRDLYE